MISNFFSLSFVVCCFLLLFFFLFIFFKYNICLKDISKRHNVHVCDTKSMMRKKTCNDEKNSYRRKEREKMPCFCHHFDYNWLQIIHNKHSSVIIIYLFIILLFFHLLIFLFNVAKYHTIQFTGKFKNDKSHHFD